MPGWLSFLLQNIELVITGLGILLTVFFTISSVITAISKANKERQKELEKRRRRAQKEREQREANPATQSYEAYLKRTESPSDAAADTAQSSLRETLAQKMGRPSAKPADELSKIVQPRDPQTRDPQTGDAQAAIPRKLSPQRIQPRIEVSLDVPEAAPTTPIRTQGTNNRTATNPTSADRPRATGGSFKFKPNDIVRATIWAEILGPPKARQGRGRGTNRRHP